MKSYFIFILSDVPSASLQTTNEESENPNNSIVYELDANPNFLINPLSTDAINDLIQSQNNFLNEIKAKFEGKS